MEHTISLQDAINMTTLFREQREQIIAPEFAGQDILCNSETFAREDIDALLQQPDCVKLRIYYGMDEAMKVHAILVGVNSMDADILKTNQLTGTITTLDSTIEGDDAVLLENALRCPIDCPPESLLNP